MFRTVGLFVRFEWGTELAPAGARSSDTGLCHL